MFNSSGATRDLQLFSKPQKLVAFRRPGIDMSVIEPSMAGLLKTVAVHGPTSLASEALVLLRDESSTTALNLFEY